MKNGRNTKREEGHKAQTELQKESSTSAHKKLTVESFAGNSPASKQPRVVKEFKLLVGRKFNANEQRVLETVRNSDIPITPKEIAGTTGINHNYVRTIIRKLERLGSIRKSFYGHYESVENVQTLDPRGLRGLWGGSQSSGELMPCVHSLQFVVRGVKGLDGKGLEPVVFSGGLVRLDFVGYPNGTMVVYVSGGFDAVSFPLLVEFLKSKLGVSEEQLVPKQVEFNNDIAGLKLQGAKSLTVKGIQGDLIRLYNKSKQTLRYEVKPVHAPRTVAEIQALLSGGMTPYYILQSVGTLVAEVKRLFEAQKFGNRTNAEISSFLKTIAEKHLKEDDSDV